MRARLPVDPAGSPALAEIGRVLRPGVRPHPFGPRHTHLPDPVQHARSSQPRVINPTPWRWPWSFQLTQRIELARADAPPRHPRT
jgi:hypothetical protein